jgi:hypothetical protein
MNDLDDGNLFDDDYHTQYSYDVFDDVMEVYLDLFVLYHFVVQLNYDGLYDDWMLQRQVQEQPLQLLILLLLLLPVELFDFISFFLFVYENKRLIEFLFIYHSIFKITIIYLITIDIILSY